MPTLPARLARRLLSLDDFERAAQRHLPRPLFGYIAGAAEDNQAFHANRQAFAHYALLPRVLVDIAQRSTARELFGVRYAQPFGIAPMGISALTAYRGDLVLARAAGQAQVPMIMSGSSLIRLEDVAKANPQAWFQAYLPGDEANILALVERVKRAGFGTLVITVDVPLAANRENNLRSGFSLPLRPTPRLAWDGLSHPRWLLGTFLRTLLRHGMPHFENNYAYRGAPVLSPKALRDYSDRGHLHWAHLALIRRHWPGRLVVKGILHPADAQRAQAEGADGVIVSNHGGRQLDGALAPLHALPAVIAACPGLPVMLDSGVRRGTDVIKALALGAAFVFVGRPFGFAAAVGGEAGVAHALGLLGSEVSRDLALLGLCTLDELGPALLAPAGAPLQMPAQAG
ncbi:alpha-hydroxy-acid oxidizing protein [Pseudomonas sp. NPDC007930]|uniref:alpha-hydroxy acid oxidase n=1 Tax=Pseudomonas sp. NPDC007930 TaxID=3364417 RepID=UPI0036E03AB9